MLDNLEQMGIVTRVRSAEDRRVVLTRLTDEGRRLRDEKRREVRGAFVQALTSLSARDLAAAPRILRLLAGAMETM
jgi:DNA-binding MarR family transcriptional regulator